MYTQLCQRAEAAAGQWDARRHGAAAWAAAWAAACPARWAAWAAWAVA